MSTMLSNAQTLLRSSPNYPDRQTYIPPSSYIRIQTYAGKQVYGQA